MTALERTHFLALIVTVVVYGWYFVTALTNLPTDMNATDEFGPRLWTMMGVYVVLIIVIAILGNINQKEPEEYDERDNFIDMKAERIGSYIQATAIFLALVLVMFEFSTFVVAHTLLAAMVLSTIIVVSIRLYLYRRGF